jgi:hypothetical protein
VRSGREKEFLAHQRIARIGYRDDCGGCGLTRITITFDHCYRNIETSARNVRPMLFAVRFGEYGDKFQRKKRRLTLRRRQKNKIST